MLDRCGRVFVPVILSAVVLVTAGQGQVAAQSSEAAAQAPGIEFGASSGMLVIFPTFGVRVTGVLSPRFALEGLAEAVPWTLDETGATYQLFQGQLRHTFHRGRSWTWHATYGGTVFTHYTYTKAYTSRLSDGSILMFPEQRSFRFNSGLAHAGIGGERRLSSGVSFRWDIQGLQSLTGPHYPVPRGSVGITWR